jgi:hypothetical protein
MPSIRVLSNGPSSLLGAAMLPVPASDARAYQARGKICGNPGTDRVPAPRPQGVTQDYTYTALHKSSDAPEYWCPSVYYQPQPPVPPDVAWESDNQMPVPAVNPVRKPAVMMRGGLFLRNKQVGAVNTVAVYPWWNNR